MVHLTQQFACLSETYSVHCLLKVIRNFRSGKNNDITTFKVLWFIITIVCMIENSVYRLLKSIFKLWYRYTIRLYGLLRQLLTFFKDCSLLLLLSTIFVSLL